MFFDRCVMQLAAYIPICLVKLKPQSHGAGKDGVTNLTIKIGQNRKKKIISFEPADLCIIHTYTCVCVCIHLSPLSRADLFFCSTFSGNFCGTELHLDVLCLY